MQEPIWIDKPEALLAHSMQLAEHGGSAGIRDETLLDSALAKPRNGFAYGDPSAFPGSQHHMLSGSPATMPLSMEINVPR
jgi:hypothetical protein